MHCYKSLLCVQLPSTGENCESLTKRMIHMSVREYAHRCKRKKAVWKSEWKEMAFSVFSMMKLWEYRLTVSYEWRRNQVVEYLGSAQVFLDKGLQVPLCYGAQHHMSFIFLVLRTHIFPCFITQKFCINVNERHTISRSRHI